MPDIHFDSETHFLSFFNELMAEIKMISKEEIQEGEEKANEYFDNRSIDIKTLPLFSIYVIISKLSEKEQIDFIRDNTEYIRKHDEDIFLYDMGAPCSLVNYLSLNVLKEIKKIDKNITQKIICGSFGEFFKGINPKDFYDFYDLFKEELMNMKNNSFINTLYYPFRSFYGIEDEYLSFSDKFEKQREFNDEFIRFIVESYKIKIDSFSGKELLNFIDYISDEKLYVSFFNDNRDKINETLKEFSCDDLNQYLSNLNYSKQEAFIKNFYNSIICEHDISKLFQFINPKIILKIYKNDVKAFESVSLKNWVDMCEICNSFNSDFAKILDCFELNEVESFFNERLKLSTFDYRGVKTLRYLENKFRNNIVTDSNICDIGEDISIFSNLYLKNIKELKEMFKNNIIDRNSDVYRIHFNKFIKYINARNILTVYDEISVREIEKLFYRIVNGASLTILNEVKNIEDIALFNRVGEKEFIARYFSIEQIQKYSVKNHRDLCENRCSGWDVKTYKTLVLKLMFLVGYNRCKYMLDIDDSVTTLEHLVGNVSVRNIQLDKDGNPIVNSKIINLLFKDLHHSRIKEMLENKESELYKYFPRIFNEWDMIEMGVKDETLNSIISFLKSDDITVPPWYYRLEGMFKDIGCKNDIVKETFRLHDFMMNRQGSTIPNVKGEVGDYSYEVLNVDDVNALVVGNQTDCCFTVLGVGRDCLKHAVTSVNGRVLTVKKNGVLVAHSWLWRNGNVLCIDNIEVAKFIKEIDFIDVYKAFAENIVWKSCECESKRGITNVMLGNSFHDKNIIGVKNFNCFVERSNILNNDFLDKLNGINYQLINLPRPIEQVGYSDSKNIQYLLKGKGDFNYYQSEYIYDKERNDVLSFDNVEDVGEIIVFKMNKKINALRYLLSENKKNYKVIDVSDYREAYCNDDWYVLVDKKGNIEQVALDDNSKEEINNVLKNRIKRVGKR